MNLKEVYKKAKLKVLSLTAIQKKVVLIAALCIAVLIAGLSLFLSFKNISSVTLGCFDSGKDSSLYALNYDAKRGCIKSNGFATFKFHDNQRDFFKKVYENSGNCALAVRIILEPTSKQKDLFFEGSVLPFKFGFLWEEDFSSKGKFISDIYALNKKISVQANEAQADSSFVVSLALDKNAVLSGKVPVGFFVYSTVKCKIDGTIVIPSKVGFDKTSSVPYYGFASNGGIIDFSNSSFDFSGASLVFSTVNNTKNRMPEYVIKMWGNTEQSYTLENPIKVEVNFGGEKYYLNKVDQAHELTIPSAALKDSFARFDIKSNKEGVAAVILRDGNREPERKGKIDIVFPDEKTQKSSDSENKEALSMAELKKSDISANEVLTPIRTDPGLILKYKASMWRTLDYEVFEWDRFPGILFFDMRNLEIQDRFFQRMAFFVEKEGYKGRLWSNEQLAGKHAYNAHDYSAVSMAEFFNKAIETGFTLNYEEELLKRILLKNYLLEWDGEYLKANEGGLVSISQETNDWSRGRLLAHEGWHTLYFRDSEFRNYVSAVYYTMDQKSLQFLKDYFKSQPTLGYDQSDDYLMKNEFMAYIMQQPLSGVADNFVNWANWGTVNKFTPELAEYVRNTKGRGFEDAAIALNDFVFDKYGIVCGDIALVRR